LQKNNFIKIVKKNSNTFFLIKIILKGKKSAACYLLQATEKTKTIFLGDKT